MSTTTLPPILLTRPFTANAIDHQLSDRSNLGLSDDAAAALSALLTAACMVLLADLVFRIVVRARPRAVSSFAVHRAFLLARVTNPVTFSVWMWHRATDVGPPQSAAGQGGQKMSADEEEGGDGADVGVSSKGANFGRPKEGPSAFPWASRIFIVVLGLSLVVCEFAFIFLATTSTSVYPTDPTQLTTMNLRDDASRVGLDISDVLQRGCKVVPITVKPHFIAQARHSLCTRVTSRAAASTSDGADGVAVVRVGLFRGQELVINVSTTGGSREARFRQTVKSGASSMYDILPAITMRDIRTAVPAVLRRYGLGVPDAAGQPFSIPGPLRSATVGLAFRADLTGRVPPPPFSSTGVAAHAAWELYLTNVTASLLRFEARGPARARWDDTELFTIRGIVLRRAPRLGALGVVVVFAVLLVVWAGVAGGLRWGAGVAHHLAWVGRFDGMRGVDDLGGREQRFDVETRRVVA